MDQIKNILHLMRIKHWSKNFFIYFPLIFSGQLFREGAFFQATFSLLGFCFLSSSIYILNDLLDSENDKHHPHKSGRPLSREAISRTFAIVLSLFFLIAGLCVCSLINFGVLLMGVLYILLHVVYNIYAKNVVILDVIFIAMGFQIRIWAGALAIDVAPSVWLQMCVFVLALFLGFVKRSLELKFLKDSAQKHRIVLSHYTSYLLDQIIIICSTLAIVFYGLYTISSDVVLKLGSYDMVYSVAFVIYGIFRYLYLAHVKRQGDEPSDILFSDRPIFWCVFLWIVSIVWMIYF